MNDRSYEEFFQKTIKGIIEYARFRFDFERVQIKRKEEKGYYVFVFHHGDTGTKVFVPEEKFYCNINDKSKEIYDRIMENKPLDIWSIFGKSKSYEELHMEACREHWQQKRDFYLRGLIGKTNRGF